MKKELLAWVRLQPFLMDRALFAFGNQTNALASSVTRPDKNCLVDELSEYMHRRASRQGVQLSGDELSQCQLSIYYCYCRVLLANSL